MKFGLRIRRYSAITVVGLAAACSSAGDAVVAGPDDLGHIHDLAVESDGSLLAATHRGLYRIEESSRAVLVGTEQHDLMSMTASDGDLVASGHPDLREPVYAVDGKPPFLGLARSMDGGITWSVESLLGEADFHALVAHPEGLFAAETTGQIWLLAPDTNDWARLGKVDARDLAIHPVSADLQLAPDYDGGVWISTDRAATWALSADAPDLIEIEWPVADFIVGVDVDGTIWTTGSLNESWVPAATGPQNVETLFIDETGRWWITSLGGAIAYTDDRGATWTEAYVPPDQ